MATASDEGERAERLTRMVEMHFDFVFRLLRRMGFDSSASEDVCQEVFLVAVRRLDAIEPGKERTFLYGAALRAAANARRSVRRRREVPEADVVRAGSSESLPDDAANRAHASRILDAALAKLKPELARVLVLSDVIELDMAEIAELERIPVGTVASRLRRARRRVKTLLARFRNELQWSPR